MDKMMDKTLQTVRSTVKRGAHRASYEAESVYAILDAATICHVGFVVDGQARVNPINYWRDGDRLYVHGSHANSLLRAMTTQDVCVNVSILDGLVLARSAPRHSVNYRSVVLFGRAEKIEDNAEKTRLFEAMFEKLLPGRWDEIRKPTENELTGVALVGLPINDASLKARSGPPGDMDEDYALPVWAGELPVVHMREAPIADPRLDETVALPDYLKG